MATFTPTLKWRRTKRVEKGVFYFDMSTTSKEADSYYYINLDQVVEIKPIDFKVGTVTIDSTPQLTPKDGLYFYYAILSTGGTRIITYLQLPE